jgi:apolipoprotein N-acyltransferase
MLIACVGGGLADILLTRRVRIAVLPALVVLAAVAYGELRITTTETTRGPTICLLAPSDIQGGKVNRDSIGTADIILSAEAEYSFKRDGIDKLQQLASKTQVVAVVGSYRFNNNQARRNSIVVINADGTVQGFYDKQYLVPGSEFTPYGPKSSQRIRGTAAPVFKVREHYFAASICYDLAFQRLYRRFMEAERTPDFFVVASNENQDGCGLISRHCLAMARIRAVEFRRSVVRNVRGGYSGVVDSNGQVQGPPLPWSVETATCVGPVPIDSRRSVYATLGDWPLYSVLLVFGGATVWRAVANKLKLAETFAYGKCKNVDDSRAERELS